MEQGGGEDEEKPHPQDGDDRRADLVGGIDDVVAPAAQEALRQPGEPTAGGFGGGDSAVHDGVLTARVPGAGVGLHLVSRNPAGVPDPSGPPPGRTGPGPEI